MVILKRLRDAEGELEKKRGYIFDLEKRVPGAIYIPVKGDDLDKRMAEYLNNYPEK